MTTTPAAMNNAGAPKKPYATPDLKVYGDIRQITQAIGNGGMGDGGANPMHKTA
jgi:hypothetical protein